MHHRAIHVYRLSLLFCALPVILQGCQLQSKHDLQLSCDRHTDLQCAMLALKTSDRQLDTMYQYASDTEEDESIKRLARSQRNWFKFRDSYAEFISLREIDATKSQLALINQKVDSNLIRIDELNKLVKTR